MVVVVVVVVIQESEENSNSIVQAVGDFIGVPFAESEISVSRRSRVNKFTTRDPAIIVKFVRRDVRDNFYKARKNLYKKTTKDVGLSRTSEHNIYISDSLTKRNRDLFNACLKARNDIIINHKFVWTQGGKIFLRKDDTDRSTAIHIKTEGVLQRLYARAGVVFPARLNAAINERR